jgi:hypothetical protein
VRETVFEPRDVFEQLKAKKFANIGGPLRKGDCYDLDGWRWKQRHWKSYWHNPFSNPANPSHLLKVGSLFAASVTHKF